MAVVYIPEDLILRIYELKKDRKKFIQDAIIQKLEREENIWVT